MGTLLLMRFDYYKSYALGKLLEVQEKAVIMDRQKKLLLSFSHELRNVSTAIIGNLELA